MGEFMGARQIAVRLGVTRRTVQRWLVAGKFPNAQRLHGGEFVASHGYWVVPLSDVEDIERRMAEEKKRGK